jgi:hypothetical protein
MQRTGIRLAKWKRVFQSPVAVPPPLQLHRMRYEKATVADRTVSGIDLVIQS